MSDATRLRVRAEQCFRLASGGAGPKLAGELEALGRACEREAREVEASLLQRSAQQSTSLSQHYVEVVGMAESV